MIFLLPENVSTIIKLLTEAGFEALAVGGCVRDMLLGETPKDWDITTSAEPEQIKALFRRTVDTGIKHGTVTVLIGNEAYETTTYRMDGKYEDSRHPSEVTFTKSLKEDLLRRDFTINAMAYNEEMGLVDEFEGQKDLEEGIIRCVGVPYERFSEDALRILRAYRFSARFGFDIEKETRKAAGQLAHNLTKVSAERIREELSKLLISKGPEKLVELYEDGISSVILPELNGFLSNKTYAAKTLCEIRERLANTVISEHDAVAFAWGSVIAAVCEGKSLEERKVLATALMHKLKFDNESVRMAAGLAQYFDYKLLPEEEPVRRAINKMGEKLFELWLLYSNDAKVEALAKQIRERGDCIFLKQLSLNGSDLCASGFENGEKMGRCLAYLLDCVLSDQSLNTKDKLQKLALEYYKQ